MNRIRIAQYHTFITGYKFKTILKTQNSMLVDNCVRLFSCTQDLTPLDQAWANWVDPGQPASTKSFLIRF